MALMRRSRAAPQPDFFPGFTDVVEIGVGSLATVYQARETGTDRLVALKLLNLRDASPRALESFERESLALGAVGSHPNIVTMYRSFLAADQRPVLVLELCRGSIGDRMRGAAGLPVADVVALGIKIAGALETAHRAQILHRDVKPQNILVTEFGEPALADFGVAMLQSSSQTTAGLFDFTTLHAAPELLEGGHTSAATDVYELASTLYQLIAGRAAFRSYDGESPASVILRILRDPVQPLVNTQAPASLSDLLLHAMSKDQGNRPPTAGEFAAGLAAVELEQHWPRTQFPVRNADGTTDLPAITRVPDPPVPTVTPVPAPTSGPPRAVAVPVAQWSSPVLPGQTGARANERILVERQVVERLVFEPRPAAGNEWSDVSLVRSQAVEAQPQVEVETRVAPPDPATRIAEPVETDEQPHYPIPPSGMREAASAGTGDVPTWAVRATAHDPAAAGGHDDIVLDPMALRSKLTLRAGGVSLVVDDSGLALRVRMRRSSIPWSDVLGFEPRVDDDGRAAQLVVRTPSGPVELAATRRPASEVRYLHALLDAYRRRAAILRP